MEVLNAIAKRCPTFHSYIKARESDTDFLTRSAETPLISKEFAMVLSCFPLLAEHAPIFLILYLIFQWLRLVNAKLRTFSGVAFVTTTPSIL